MTASRDKKAYETLTSEIATTEKTFRANIKHFVDHMSEKNFDFLSPVEKMRFNHFLGPYKNLAEKAPEEYPKPPATTDLLWMKQLAEQSKKDVGAVVKNFEESQKFFAELQKKYGKKYPGAFAINEVNEKGKVVKTSTISDYLIQPVQRFPRYNLFAVECNKKLSELKETIKEDLQKAKAERDVARDKGDVAALKAAYDQIKECTRRAWLIEHGQSLQSKLKLSGENINKVPHHTKATSYLAAMAQYLDEQKDNAGAAKNLLQTVSKEISGSKSFLLAKDRLNVLLKEKTVPKPIKKDIQKFLKKSFFKKTVKEEKREWKKIVAKNKKIARQLEQKRYVVRPEQRVSTLIEKVDARITEHQTKINAIRITAQAIKSPNVDKLVAPYQQQIARLSQLRSDLHKNKNNISACKQVIERARSQGLLKPIKSAKEVVSNLEKVFNPPRLGK